ncbi:MAG: hypothetical protein M1832_003351 [Thelocarpon impressellum]|nr:MAG: hypothetical protein M1832_003351 [Thelocarpon impressellum]
MIRTYQDELRKLGGDADEMETVDSRRLEVDSTGALITLDNAMAHLYHFCAILPHKAYAELSPAFAFDQDAKTKLILATVTLPSSVDPSVRQTSGLKRWRTERAAKKDAAFEAYVRLRSVGLINDHLLPLWEDDRKDPRPATDVCSLVDVPEQYSPWRDVAEDFPALFTPDIDVPGLEAWLARNTGVRPARGEADARAPASDEMGLVRDKLKSGEAYTFLRWIEGDDSNDGGTRMSAVEVLPLPKRRDFLHSDYEVTGQGSPVSPQVSSKRKAQVLSVDNCSFDNLPFKYTRFALFIPSILHLLEVSLVADRVRQQVIPSVDIRDCNLVITAICASSAREPSNYQKLELLGDSVLKFLATAQLFVEHVNWHEGYLSMGKECIVSNSRLARAARDRSLDRFIITKSFTGRKWSPSDLLVSSPDATRVMPSKVLADVVESLIGAAFVDGGLQKSAKCASVFLSELDGIPPDVKFASFSPTPELATESDMAELEDMIGYSFSNKGILREAMTHPSCENDSASLSYQRLEFLGDSLLDYVVVTTLHREYKGLPHTELHLAKTALVNASFLAYLCLELSALQHGVEVHQRGRTFDTVPTARATQLWGFMRHHNTEIVQAQQGCAGRHSQLREAIKSALTSGLSYPWVELTQLEAPKFFSDVVESLVGAIFVDSKGDLSACTRFVERIGMLRYLRRVGVDGPDLLHPKERLGHLAGNRTVAYKVGVEDGAAYWCAVEVAGIEIVRVGGGSSRVEAETRAAREASAMMLDGESRKRSWADN